MSDAIEKGDKYILPKGVYNASFPGWQELRCSQHISAQTCRMQSELPDLNLKFNYYIQTYPSDHVNGGSLETSKWPYKYYPRAAWSMLEKEMRAHLKNLIYEEHLGAE